MERTVCVSTVGRGLPVDRLWTGRGQGGTNQGTVEMSVVSDDGFGPDPAGFLGDLDADAGADTSRAGFEHCPRVVDPLDAARGFYA